MNLGNKIISLRKDNKMSQSELAEVLNVTRQTISNWETSKNYPDIETLIKISDKFNISLDILLKSDKKMIKEIDKKVKNNKIKNIVIIILVILFVIISSLIGVKAYKEYTMKKIAQYQTIVFEKNGERTNIRLKYDFEGKALNEEEYNDFFDNAKVEKVEIFNGDKTLLEQMNINVNDFNNYFDLECYIRDWMKENGYELIKFVGVSFEIRNRKEYEYFDKYGKYLSD